jgi:hypothetical protein
MDRPLLIHRQGSHRERDMSGTTCVMEAGSMSRSNGISIDYVGSAC